MAKREQEGEAADQQPPDSDNRVPFDEADWYSLIGRVERLPQEPGEVWQVDVRRVTLKLAPGRPAGSYWTLAVVNPDQNQIGSVGTYDDDRKPSPDSVLINVLGAMCQPVDGQPHRPGSIQVCMRTYAKAWAEILKTVGVRCERLDCLDSLDQFFQVMKEIGPVWPHSPDDEVDGDRADDDEVDGDRADDDEAFIAEMDELASLPQDPDRSWQMDVRELAIWINHAGRPQRPWAAMVVDEAMGLIVGYNLMVEEDVDEFLWDTLVTAMLAPMSEEDPVRPGTLRVSSDELREALSPYLDALEIECVVCDAMEELDTVYSELTQNMGQSQKPAMIDTPGVKLEHVARLFAAAAAYYEKRPWRRLAIDLIIKIRCDRFETDTWYAVVMGQSAMTYGLALYEDFEVLDAILSGEEDADRQNAALSVVYGDAYEIPARDLEAAEQHGWPVADPSAYPLAMRVNPGMATRPALAWEMELLEAALQAIPQFLEDAGEEPAKMRIATTTGDLNLELSRL